MRARSYLFLGAALSLGAGCEDTKVAKEGGLVKEQAKQPGKAKPKPAAGSEKGMRAIIVKEMDENHRLSVRLPKGYRPFGTMGEDHWVPEQFAMNAPSVKFSVNCGGMCDAKSLPKNVDNQLKSLIKMSGKEELNFNNKSFEGKVEQLDSGTLGHGGKWVTYRITYPSKDKTGCPENVCYSILYGAAYHVKPGRSYYINTTIEAPVSQEKGDWPELLQAMKATRWAE